MPPTSCRPPSLLVLCTALLMQSGLVGAAVEIEIAGVGGKLRKAVRDRLTLGQYAQRDVSTATLRHQFRYAEREIREALEPFGYYDVDVDAQIEEHDEQTLVTFSIDRGEPVVVRRCDVEVIGDAAEIPEVAAALESFAPGLGHRLDHARYEASKAAIGSALRYAGYLDAALERHRVAVTLENRSAAIDVVWDPGPRYRFGEVRFPDVQFPRDFLAGFVTWQEDDFYSTAQLLDLQARLTATNYFQTVAVQPDLDARGSGVVPVEVLLTENERNAYSAGLYYSTDFGAGTRLEYERRWLNDRGHTLNAVVEYSQRLEEYGLTYSIPRPGRRERNFTLGVAYSDEQTVTSSSRTARVAAAESRKHWKGFTRTLGLQYLRGDFEIAGEPGRSTVLFAEGTLSRRQFDDFAWPREGYALDLGVRVAPSEIVSDTSLAQIWASGRYLQGHGDDDRLIARLDLGAMTVDDFDALPPELRFFAGGDRSVRGFDYQAIGERNAEGGVIGGQYLATGSIEYEHLFEPDWGAAVFVDGGDAFTSQFDMNVSVGIGARWRSPVGVVRLDFAKPVVTRFEDGWRIHLTIGPVL